ncbi:hypothetical protein NFI96_020378, partial [Prochilodus magdalenae]
SAPDPAAVDLVLKENTLLREEILQLKQQIEKLTLEHQFGIHHFAGSDRDIRFYTRRRPTAIGIQQPHDLPAGSHPIHTAPVNLPGPATLHLLPYELFPVIRSCSTGLQDCQSVSHPEETLTGLLRRQLDSLDVSSYSYHFFLFTPKFFLSQNQLQDIKQSGFKPAHPKETALIAVTERLHAARSARLSLVLILFNSTP